MANYDLKVNQRLCFPTGENPSGGENFDCDKDTDFVADSRVGVADSTLLQARLKHPFVSDELSLDGNQCTTLPDGLQEFGSVPEGFNAYICADAKQQLHQVWVHRSKIQQKAPVETVGAADRLRGLMRENDFRFVTLEALHQQQFPREISAFEAGGAVYLFQIGTSRQTPAGEIVHDAKSIDLWAPGAEDPVHIYDKRILRDFERRFEESKAPSGWDKPMPRL